MNTRKIRLVKGDEHTCPKCGSADIAPRTYSDTVDFRDLELDIEGLQDSKCNQCGYVWAKRDQTNQNNALIRAVYAEKRDQMRTALGLLSGEAIAHIREGLGLTQREAAALFGGGYNAFNKYESGEVLQSFAMDRLLRLSRVIGKPVVSFFRDVSSPPAFIVIATTSATASDASVYITPARPLPIGKSFTTVASTDSGSTSVQQYPRPERWNKHENYAIGR